MLLDGEISRCPMTTQTNQTKNTRDELKKIIMGWRHKVRRLEVDVIEGKISRRKWRHMWMSDADRLDEEINKGLADDIEKLLDQTKQETEKELKAKLIDALENHKRTLNYIVKDHAPKNATNYEVYLRKAIEVDVKIDKLSDTAHTALNKLGDK
jgi:hypothetical protein